MRWRGALRSPVYKRFERLWNFWGQVFFSVSKQLLLFCQYDKFVYKYILLFCYFVNVVSLFFEFLYFLLGTLQLVGYIRTYVRTENGTFCWSCCYSLRHVTYSCYSLHTGYIERTYEPFHVRTYGPYRHHLLLVLKWYSTDFGTVSVPKVLCCEISKMWKNCLVLLVVDTLTVSYSSLSVCCIIYTARVRCCSPK